MATKYNGTVSGDVFCGITNDWMIHLETGTTYQSEKNKGYEQLHMAVVVISISFARESVVGKDLLLQDRGQV